MRLNRQQEKESTRENHDGYPGDLWYAMSRLHAAHPEPVGRSVPFERPSALLSFMEPDDIVLAARVGLSGTETLGRLHDLINTVTRGLSGDSRIGESALVPDIELEVTVGRRQELALHTGHIAGLTKLLRESIGTLGISTPGARTPVAGQCFHCEGTGHARPLWERSRTVPIDLS
ncbi:MULTISPECIES: hypothetical protein [Streptomyces]|uniref:Uncharacterized protein n=1 Tax=Streptomyces bottropensis ATCC 25435 TaxID=1054862 RepID=M3FU61_9ACTN|nr:MULTISPECIES: hypothetical protein [Streptomyces]EMF56515.1 hypothetical protein SBD_2076 [Streptomyces bottropensis ATCC 25435]MZD16963.1 hypothetical protein [Streptomyces sp. SID5476]